MASTLQSSLDENAGLAFGLVIAAGLSTALGAAAVFEKRLVKLASKRVLAAGLGFSGGVMIYVSFVEIFVKSQGAFEEDGREPTDAYLCATVCLFAGMALLRLISMLVHRMGHSHGDALDNALNAAQPEGEPGAAQPAHVTVALEEGSSAAAAPQENSAEADTSEAQKQQKEATHNAELQKMGINTAVAIAIHNFPEGLATFVATLAEPSVGITLAIAIGIHNIPEGLCVALPIYYATDSRLKGFLWALLSGISEPVGALIGYAIIKSTGDDMSQVVYGVLFGLVAGMMIMIVILELLPTAYRYDPTDTCVTNSVVVGMLVMAASLCLFLA
jgi:ZIP family zinc transporter